MHGRKFEQGELKYLHVLDLIGVCQQLQKGTCCRFAGQLELLVGDIK